MRIRSSMRNAVFINTATPRFLEAAYLTGLASSDWTWAVKVADYDNDGWVDVFFTNGAARMFNHSDYSPKESDWPGKTEWDLWEAHEERREENLAFRNEGDLKFADVSEIWGLSESSMSYACAHGDLDGDGDLDLIIADLDEPIAIYQNHSQSRSLQLRLKGRGKNTFGLGARIQVRVGEKVQAMSLMPASGFLSCNEPALHVGLGEAEQIDEMVVHWSSGGSQVLKNLAAGMRHVIEEDPEAKALRTDRGHPLFALFQSTGGAPPGGAL